VPKSSEQVDFVPQAGGFYPLLLLDDGQKKIPKGNILAEIQVTE